MKIKIWLTLVLSMMVPYAMAGAEDGSKRFSDNSMKGTWALAVRGETASGSFLAPPGTALVAVATVTFDGRGNCSSIDQIIIGGLFIPSRDDFRETDVCTYSVNPDGTGFFDVVFDGAGPTNVTFVLEDNKSLHFIANNEILGIFGGGTMHKQ